MIYQDDGHNAQDQTLYLAEYHRYWLNKAERIKNPDFDRFSAFILNLKERQATAIEYFRRRIAPILAPGPTVITCVPSSTAGKLATGISALTTALATDGRVDGSDCLRRTRTVPKAALGGPRSEAIHRTSILIDHPDQIAGREVLLLDDVTTSGSSLAACKFFLEEAGAAVVRRLALAKTAPH